MSLLDQLLGGYVYIQENGTTAPTEKTLNFVGATVADDPGNSRTTVTISGGAPSGAATGDLSGTYPAPTVAKLQNQPVSAAVPASADVLTWSGSAWAPAAPAAGGITQLTVDVAAGPGAGSQAASVAEATGELTGPGGVASWWLPNKAGSIGLCNSPDGSPVAIYRNPAAFPGFPSGAYAMIAADAGNVSVGGSVAGNGDTLTTVIKSQYSVEIRGTAGRLVIKTASNITNGNQSLIGIYQPFRFRNAEVYLGGGPFACDTGLLTTTLIECNFAGGFAGIINLPGLFAPPDTEPGRVLHIGDAAATINAVATLTLQPRPNMSVGGGALGVPLVINAAGWAQKLVLDSSGVNWMIF